MRYPGSVEAGGRAPGRVGGRRSPCRPWCSTPVRSSRTSGTRPPSTGPYFDGHYWTWFVNNDPDRVAVHPAARWSVVAVLLPAAVDPSGDHRLVASSPSPFVGLPRVPALPARAQPDAAAPVPARWPPRRPRGGDAALLADRAPRSPDRAPRGRSALAAVLVVAMFFGRGPASPPHHRHRRLAAPRRSTGLHQQRRPRRHRARRRGARHPAGRSRAHRRSRHGHLGAPAADAPRAHLAAEPAEPRSTTTSSCHRLVQAAGPTHPARRSGSLPVRPGRPPRSALRPTVPNPNTWRSSDADRVDLPQPLSRVRRWAHPRSSDALRVVTGRSGRAGREIGVRRRARSVQVLRSSGLGGAAPGDGVDQPLGRRRATSSSGASTITRTSGSVPLGRTSTRPGRPARPRRRRCRRPIASSDVGVAARPPARSTSTWGSRVMAVGGQLGERPAGPRAAGRAAARRSAGRRRWWPGRRKITWPDCSPPSDQPPRLERLEHVAVADLRSRPPRCPCSAMASRNPRLVMTVTTTVSSAQLAPVAQVDGAEGDEVVAVDQLRRSRRRPAPGRRRRRTPARRRRPAPPPRACRSSGWVEPQPVVDVAAVGLGVQHLDRRRPSRREHVGGDGRGRPVGAVDHDLRARRGARPRARPTSDGVAPLDVGARRSASAGVGADGGVGRRRSASRRSSSASSSRLDRRRTACSPPAAKNLMPLSPNGLCDAEIIAAGHARGRRRPRPPPGWAPRPSASAARPPAARPAARARLDARARTSRVSRPITKPEPGRLRRRARVAAARPRPTTRSVGELVAPWPADPVGAEAQGHARGPRDSALGVLRRLAGLLEAVLLGLLLAGVAGEEAGLLERRGAARGRAR